MIRVLSAVAIATLTLHGGASAAASERYIVLDAKNNDTIVVATMIEGAPGQASLVGFKTGLAFSCNAPFFKAASAKVDETKLLSCKRASTSTQRAACSC